MALCFVKNGIFVDQTSQSTIKKSSYCRSVTWDPQGFELFCICRYLLLIIFSALHGMPAWTSDEKDVCPSICQMHAL